MRIKAPFRSLACLALAAASLSACGSIRETVNGPSLTPMGYPAAIVPQQQMVTATPNTTPASANSLWRVGARTFFNDQRARGVGDILTINVEIDDSAQTSNATNGSRTNSYQAATPNVFGFESSLGKIFPSQYDPANALGASGSSTSSGSGSVKRAEKIFVTIAAVVTGVLPNGNLIVQGTQEVRTNREVRVLTVSGIARPEDVSSENTLKHTQLAEARISYGGRGDQSNMVKAPVAQTLMDRYSPF
ncbi:MULTISPECIES: flagellar basal body L-ring protein FlgH [Asticcacaulis]|uniref:flagellar basal body L-ring protein FlgH n=1 Tax=Asticcacaulis TaxID=76890 RepID=UPI001AE315DF|nr:MULTISPECIES: flagellar basal body L-ring protein FlgH [Asticcacaulis]MBP2157580.1 flagellar L-ring protein precursor FlgH [Asticcacaulis solisilvae]MDR6798625.1 flagellar L-ring protein precursor FlgH [Asticcacaulis sp. BE141]